MFSFWYNILLSVILPPEKVYADISLSWLFHFADVPVAVQVESLRCFWYLCSQSEGRSLVQLLAEFPSILVPLASYNQVVVWALVTFNSLGCLFYAKHSDSVRESYHVCAFRFGGRFFSFPKTCAKLFLHSV